METKLKSFLTTCFRCTSRAMQPSVFSLQCVSRRSRLLVENYRTSCKTHVETYGQRTPLRGLLVLRKDFNFVSTFGFLFPLLTTCFRCTSRAMQPSVFSLQCVSRRSRLLVEKYRTSCKTHVETYGQRHLSEAFWF